MRSATLLLLLPLAFLPLASEAQEGCPEGAISHIFVDNHSIFDPDAVPEEGNLRWLYRLTNAIHIRTREEFIRGELLFQVGDCYEEEAVQETGRILREFRFIARADVFGIPQGDGTVHVVVDTRDEWTTKLSVGIRLEDGLQFDGAAVVEENFLGRGAAVGLFHTNRDERRASGVLTEVPRVRGSGWDILASAERSRVGTSVRQMLVQPFLGELDRNAFRQRTARSQTLFAYDLPEGSLYSHLVIPLTTERMELSGARRWGGLGELWVLGGGVSYERVRPGDPGEAEAVRDSNFGDRVPVGEDLMAPIVSHLNSRQAFRLNLILGARRLHFQTRRGLDALDGVQDLPVGQEALLSLGRSVGSTGTGRPGDLFGRFDLRIGALGPATTSFLALAAEGRREDRQGGVGGGWADLLMEGHGFFYWQIPGTLPQTLVLRATTQGGWATTSPFQLTLGGPAGVRGYLERELPVGRKTILTVENRVRLPGPFPELADLGVTLFGDLGAGWEGDAPFGQDTGWRGTVGAGLRVGFPPGSAAVLRADLAFPVGPGASSRSPVFRIAAREWIGLLDDFRSLDLARSRRSGIQGDYIGVARGAGVP